jgi:hypothetical protein
MSQQTNDIREEKIFYGGLNTDDDPRLIPQGDYTDAVNVTPLEDGSGGILVNIKGNSNVYNGGFTEEILCGWGYKEKTLATDDCVVLATYYLDGAVYKSRIFTYRPEADIAKNLIAPSSNTLLNFKDPTANDYFIKINVLDDWIEWDDNYNPPRMINESSVSNNQYTNSRGSIISLSTEILDVNKLQPTASTTVSYHPVVSYGYDSSLSYTRLTNTYQFKYCYVYDDFRRGTYSTASNLGISPSLSRKISGDNNYKSYNFLSVGFHSGGGSVRYIDIVVRDGNTGSWGRIVRVDKDDPEKIYAARTGGSALTSLSDDTVYYYRFYNNEGRVAVGIEPDVQYSRVPDICETSTFADNRLMLGGVTEGKDSPEITVSLSPQLSNPGLFDDMDIDAKSYSGNEVYIDFDLDNTFLTRGITNAGDYIKFDFSVAITLSTAGAATAALTDEYFVFGENLYSLDDIGNYVASNYSGGSTSASYNSTTNVLRITFVYAGDTVTAVGATTVDDSIIFNRGYEYVTPSSYGYYTDQGFKAGDTHKLALVYEDKYGREFPAATSTTSSFQATPYSSSNGFGFRHVQYTLSGAAPSTAVTYKWAYAYTPKQFVQTTILNVSNFEDDTNTDVTGKIALDVSKQGENILGNYSPAVGDKIKILASGGSYAVPSIFSEGEPVFEIIDIKTTIIQSSVTYNGTWLIVSAIDVDGYEYEATATNYLTSKYYNAIVEIYRESTELQDQLFYKIAGGGYINSGGFHRDWSTDSATGYLNQGDVWVRPLERYYKTAASTSSIAKTILYLEDPYPYIDAPRADVGIGDIAVEDVDSRNKYDNIVRWSDKFFQDTQVNGLSTFQALNRADVSDVYGNIKGLEELGNILTIICEQKVLTSYIGATEYTDAEGNVNVVKSTRALGYVRPMAEDYGTYLKESILNTGRYIYFYDLYNRAYIRKASNGLYPISGKAITPDGVTDYKMKSYFNELSASLLGGITLGQEYEVKCYSGYDPYYRNVYVTFTDANDASNNITLVFNEDRGRWIARYNSYYNSKNSTFQLRTRSTFMTWYDSSIWLQNSNSTRCNLYGNQFESSIKYAANELSNNTKIFKNIAIRSNNKWHMDDDDAILTVDNDSYGVMSSKIPDGVWRLEEGVYKSQFLRNAKTTTTSINVVDLHNGDYLRGDALEIEMTNDDTTETRLFMVAVDSELSK